MSVLAHLLKIVVTWSQRVRIFNLNYRHGMCFRASSVFKSKSNQKVLFKVGTFYNNTT